MLRSLILAVGLASPAVASALSAAAPDEAEAVEILTRDGLHLAGTFYPPSARAGESLAPGALLVHDAGGNRQELVEVAQRLQRSGFGVLAFDLRGHGESRGEGRPWSELDEAGRSRLWALATRDVEAATEWLLSRDRIHSTNLSLVGLGSGCALAVRHAKRDENVRCVALLAPRSKDFGFDVASDLQKIEGLPTFVLAPHGDPESRQMVAEANGNGHPYVELDHAGARVDRVLEDRKVPGKVANWVKDCAMPKRGRG